ncbi:hypothetical protein LTR53_004897 [Teratosphaeriaceae sp. CCFEE 6253]|nr:hypothetical protein LTR53_004897 [Teratosphaeriaceae sp. CCFEE 6253]
MPLSTKQMEYLALAWQCFETEPKIDYAKFATVAGLKNARSAAELMRVAKNKLRSEHGALSAGTVGANAATTSTPNGTGTPKAAAVNGRAGSSVGETPTPAGKKRARKASAKAVEAEGDGEGDGGSEVDKFVESPAKKKRRGAAAVVKAEPAGEDEEGEDVFD